MKKAEIVELIDALDKRLSTVEKDDSLAHGDYAKVLAGRFKALEDRIAALEKAP